MGRRRKTKKFIDKKEDVVHTFKVVQRSQKDPLVADETAPQAVLVDVPGDDDQKEELHNYGIYFDDDYDYLQHLKGVQEMVDWEECDVEVYTIRNEDQKLDARSYNDVGLVLPSSAFESYIEEPIGLLNKAAPITGPRPELDPDIVAELDKDELEEGDLVSPDDEETFPDNFIALLNAEGDDEKGSAPQEGFEGVHKWLGETFSYDDMPPLEESDDEGPFPQHSNFSDAADCDSDASFNVSDDEAKDEVGSLPNSNSKTSKTRGAQRLQGTQGARSDARSRTSVASSSTVPRSELLTILDERFERLYNEEYTDDQIGGLEGEVIEGPLDVNSEVFQQAYRATLKQLEKAKLSDIEGEDKSRVIQWVKESMRLRMERGEESEEEMVTVLVKSKPKYDCQSILSLYSNTKNLPYEIDDRLMGGGKKKKSKLTRKAVTEHDKRDGETEPPKEAETATLLTYISAISVRPKDETPGERRERKNALKELRRERRKEKKENKLAFKEELKRQKKIYLNKPKSRIVEVP